VPGVGTRPGGRWALVSRRANKPALEFALGELDLQYLNQAISLQTHTICFHSPNAHECVRDNSALLGALPRIWITLYTCEVPMSQGQLSSARCAAALLHCAEHCCCCSGEGSTCHCRPCILAILLASPPSPTGQNTTTHCSRHNGACTQSGPAGPASPPPWPAAAPSHEPMRHARHRELEARAPRWRHARHHHSRRSTGCCCQGQPA